jgi:hypothetical protein
MQPNPETLLEKANIELPLIGFYDAPEAKPFEPIVEPPEGKWACVYMFYRQWLRGKTLHITKQNFGCGGMGTYLCDIQTRSRQDYIDFLYGKEGLKASPELMAEWIDGTEHYKPVHEHLLIGPLEADQYEHLKTVTFFVNPDQLSVLLTGAYYRHSPADPPAVVAPFSSGCGQMVPQFDDLDAPQAIIGATDIAMRKYLPPEILAFTVTRPMFEQLCELDENSFLYKPFLEDMKKARGQ